MALHSALMVLSLVSWDFHYAPLVMYKRFHGAFMVLFVVIMVLSLCFHEGVCTFIVPS